MFIYNTVILEVSGDVDLFGGDERVMQFAHHGGIEPPPTAFSGLLPIRPRGLESANVTDKNEFYEISDLGWLRIVCACFGSSFSRLVRAPCTLFHTLTVPEILHPPAFPYNKNKDCIEYGRAEHVAD